MKVLQILPQLNIGGVERGTLDLSKALIQNGHDAFVISGGGILVIPEMSCPGWKS